jgi:hypothetical protein
LTQAKCKTSLDPPCEKDRIELDLTGEDAQPTFYVLEIRSADMLFALVSALKKTRRAQAERLEEAGTVWNRAAMPSEREPNARGQRYHEILD